MLPAPCRTSQIGEYLAGCNDAFFSCVHCRPLQPKSRALEDDHDIKDLFKRLKDDLEDRVAKLEDLAKIGTLRSCYEYSQYGLKTSGPYMIDPDGGLIGQEPFQVLNRSKEQIYSHL